MLKICRAQLDQPLHADAVLELLDQYARDPMGGGDGLGDYTRQNLIAALSARADCSIVLAFDDASAVGLCICFEGFSTFACRPLINIHDVFVRPQYRGQGIARNMLQNVEQLASERGCCKVTLEVLRHNEIARKAYRASGYEPFRLDEAHGEAEFWQKPLSQE